MKDDNYGFDGPIPERTSIEYNIQRALEYQRTHTVEETFLWFYEHVRNNKVGHLPSNPSDPNHSMNYKQLNAKDENGNVIVNYADFGNFNYGTVGRALGMSDFTLLKAIHLTCEKMEQPMKMAIS